MDDVERIHLAVGTIVRAEPFPEARIPAYKLWVDIGDGALRQSSARITHHYTPEGLVGRQVLCVCNLPPRQVGPFRSDVLVTGFYRPDGSVILAVPDTTVPNGTRLA